MARARAIEGIDCGDSFAVAARQVIAARSEELLASSAGVLDVFDIEALHDMRVASRRLRAALEMFAPCFPRKRLRRTLGRVKEVGSALGDRRDCDVAIELAESLREEAGKGGARALDLVLLELRTEQKHANERLEPFVEDGALAELGEALDELVERVKA